MMCVGGVLVIEEGGVLDEYLNEFKDWQIEHKKWEDARKVAEEEYKYVRFEAWMGRTGWVIDWINLGADAADLFDFGFDLATEPAEPRVPRELQRDSLPEGAVDVRKCH